jgi:DNA-binding NarL/FixJ family response regulator
VNARTKIFIADYDCASLVSLMLWLEQFPEFEVSGTSHNGAHLVDRINQVNPDLVLLDINKGVAENLPVVRAIRGSASSPAILLKSQTEHINDHALSAESDGTIGPSTAVKDLCDAIRKATNKRRMALSAANMPMTKAG